MYVVNIMKADLAGKDLTEIAKVFLACQKIDYNRAPDASAEPGIGQWIWTWESEWPERTLSDEFFDVLFGGGPDPIGWIDDMDPDFLGIIMWFINQVDMIVSIEREDGHPGFNNRYNADGDDWVSTRIARMLCNALAKITLADKLIPRPIVTG